MTFVIPYICIYIIILKLEQEYEVPGLSLYHTHTHTQTHTSLVAQSAGPAEFTDCFSAEWWGSPNEFPGYNIRQSECDPLVTLELWGMWSTPSLPSLLVLVRPGVLAPDRVLSMGQREQFDI